MVKIHGEVLLGNPEAFLTLAQVDRRRVFQSIPAYQTILKERLRRSEPRYHFLLKEANDVFRRALEQATRQCGVDLVIEAGGVTALGIEVADVTSQVTAQVIALGKGAGARDPRATSKEP